MSSKKVLRSVFFVSYAYTDYELGKRIEDSHYLKDVHSLVEYFKDMEQEHAMVDAVHFRCREDIVIKVKSVFIPEKKYKSIFNDPHYESI